MFESVCLLAGLSFCCKWYKGDARPSYIICQGYHEAHSVFILSQWFLWILLEQLEVVVSSPRKKGNVTHPGICWELGE